MLQTLCHVSAMYCIIIVGITDLSSMTGKHPHNYSKHFDCSSDWVELLYGCLHSPQKQFEVFCKGQATM